MKWKNQNHLVETLEFWIKVRWFFTGKDWRIISSFFVSSSYDYHHRTLCIDGTFWILTFWFRSPRIDNIELAQKWNVSKKTFNPSHFNNWTLTFYRKAQAVQGMLAFSIFITHALACYVAIDITWNEYMAKRIQSNSSFWEYFTRTMLVFVTCKLTK